MSLSIIRDLGKFITSAIIETDWKLKFWAVINRTSYFKKDPYCSIFRKVRSSLQFNGFCKQPFYLLTIDARLGCKKLREPKIFSFNYLGKCIHGSNRLHRSMYHELQHLVGLGSQLYRTSQIFCFWPWTIGEATAIPMERKSDSRLPPLVAKSA